MEFYMSLFKKQLTAARESRVTVDLQTEDSVATESLGNEGIEEDITQEVDIDAIFDQFSEDRDRLNAMLEDGTTVTAEGEAVVTEQVEDTTEVAQTEEVTQEAETTQVEDASVSQETESEVAQEEVAVEQKKCDSEKEEEVTQEYDTEKNEDLPDDALPGYSEDDADDEDDETMVAEMTIMEEVESDVIAIEQYGRDMAMIADSIVAIESFGINPSAIAILQTTGLLTDTVLEAVGVESLGYAGPKDDQTLIALEALEAKGDDKAASWSAKIMSMAKSVGSKIMSVLGSIWEKITGTVKAIGGYTWDKAKAAGAVVKAHPYKTILAVVVAIAAVAGITVFISGGLPALAASTKTGDMANKAIKFGQTVAAKVNSIKWPFGKVAAEAAEKTGKLSLTVTSNMAAPEAAALGKMGWTSTVVKGVESTLGRAWGSIKTGAEALGSSTTSYAKTFSESAWDSASRVNETLVKVQKGNNGFITAKSAGTNFGIVAAAGLTVGIIKFVYGLIFKVVAAGLRVIYNTMKAIANAVKGSSTATA